MHCNMAYQQYKLNCIYIYIKYLIFNSRDAIAVLAWWTAERCIGWHRRRIDLTRVYTIMMFNSDESCELP